MKKTVLFYIVAILSAFSLQSCVTNYVVSEPITYKTNANLAAIPTNNLRPVKNEISPSKRIDMALASIEKTNKNIEIEKAILFEKKMDELMAEAESYLGTPYRYGGMSRSGIDCSAFVLSVFGATMGMNLPRVAASQALQGESVSKEELRKGDLVFFSRGGRISHVGIVHHIDEAGEIQFIHASTSKGVMISPLSDKYWGPKFRFAKRIIQDDLTDLSVLAQK
ncbi:C40 family peptidase [Bergeyella sp. RCAD1439]|uniref:C40 family peptidase n=1 Tax=Bergeyella anatis TaxID=3113737 RepID=UPI002E188535|nr:C40 family peptidase [Bergeyella sp. RCAD1439]